MVNGESYFLPERFFYHSYNQTQYKIQASSQEQETTMQITQHTAQTGFSDVKPQKSWRRQGGVSARFLVLLSCRRQPSCDFKLEKQVLGYKYNLLQL